MTKRDELIALADFIRDGTLAIVHCGSALGAVDASKKQRDAIEAALRLSALEAPAAGDGEPVAHRKMTREEYNALDLKGWHSVRHDEECEGVTEVSYTAQPADAAMREALDTAFCAMKDLRDGLHREPLVQGRKWVHLGSSLNDAIRKAELALTAPGATTKPSIPVLGAKSVSGAHVADRTGGANPPTGSNSDGYDARLHENILDQFGATTKSDGGEPSSRTAGGFPVAAAPYHAEETGVIQPTRERAGIERGMDQGVTGGESATTNSIPSEPKNYFFETEEEAAEAADNGRNTGGKSYYRPSDPSSTRSEVTASIEGDAVERVALRRTVLDILNSVAPAVENLACNQEQADADGCMVKVSRQAVDEVLAAVNEVAIQAATATGLVAGEALQTEYERGYNDGVEWQTVHGESAIRADEREKCAKIAESECYATTGRQIAAAIRSGGTNER